MSERRLTRLKLLQTGAVGVAGAAAAGLVAGEAEAQQAAAAPTSLKFFTNAEFALVTRAGRGDLADRRPRSRARARPASPSTSTDSSPGAWGTGDRWYMQGPFLQPADSGHGWQSPMVPRDVYRASLPAVDNYARATYGDWFVPLPAATRPRS